MSLLYWAFPCPLKVREDTNLKLSLKTFDFKTGGSGNTNTEESYLTSSKSSFPKTKSSVSASVTKCS